MEANEAIHLIHGHDIAVTDVCKTAGRRGEVKAQKELERSARELFRALVGRKPTDDELEQCVE